MNAPNVRKAAKPATTNERLDLFAEDPAAAAVCRKIDDTMRYLGLSEMRHLIAYAKRSAYLTARRRFYLAHPRDAVFMTFDEFEAAELNRS